ncbi:STAS domain-containing protein [Nonomuraea sp. 3-1Str]|uniref:STAS domain-containing protein n=1 Tax=Nonomuraea sp. 3-1Str TaxID=2929801 RepID=UPI002866D040|nr:STAS domain-containing protein [Nonomuraea sp. 3-1Str]MDR8411348.1 STAS domain-containing protein [Nonomuraea sp. 3-1Str]
MRIFSPARPGRAGPVTTIVYLTGEIDIFTGEALRRRLLRALPCEGGRLVVDVSSVSFCDASGLGVLVGIQREARSRGVALALRAPRPHMSRLLRITGLHRSLTVVP